MIPLSDGLELIGLSDLSGVAVNGGMVVWGGRGAVSFTPDDWPSPISGIMMYLGGMIGQDYFELSVISAQAVHSDDFDALLIDWGDGAGLWAQQLIVWRAGGVESWVNNCREELNINVFFAKSQWNDGAAWEYEIGDDGDLEKTVLIELAGLVPGVDFFV